MIGSLQAVARGDVAVASDQYVSALKSVALLGSLFMIIGYEAELAKSQPQNESAQVRVNPSSLQRSKDKSLRCLWRDDQEALWIES